MTRTLLVAGLCALTVAGCGRTVVRETVVERPVKETVVERPVKETTVIERPVVAATPPAACTLAGSAFATGALSCQGGIQHRCNNGVWERTGSYC